MTSDCHASLCRAAPGPKCWCFAKPISYCARSRPPWVAARSEHDAMAARALFDRLRLIRDRSQANGSDLLVLTMLFTFADADGVAFPSTKTLALAARVKVRTVELALMNLRAYGEVTSLRKRGSNGAIVRRIEFDVLAAKPDLS